MSYVARRRNMCPQTEVGNGWLDMSATKFKNQAQDKSCNFILVVVRRGWAGKAALSNGPRQLRRRFPQIKARRVRKDDDAVSA